MTVRGIMGNVESVRVTKAETVMLQTFKSRNQHENSASNCLNHDQINLLTYGIKILQTETALNQISSSVAGYSRISPHLLGLED